MCDRVNDYYVGIPSVPLANEALRKSMQMLLLELNYIHLDGSVVVPDLHDIHDTSGLEL